MAIVHNAPVDEYHQRNAITNYRRRKDEMEKYIIGLALSRENIC